MFMSIIFKNKLCNIEKYIKKLSARGRKKTWQKMLMTINNSLNHSHNLNSSIYICDVFCVCDVFSESPAVPLQLEQQSTALSTSLSRTHDTLFISWEFEFIK